ncbi:hypothetical protein [Lentibacillus amyloliquefaciens]|uniref:Uncharacterized protein n=1 Tax=Lentibacillus amyloliquefaciens TaxID=1472767 RepID=A0A0U4EVY2_9BACI|nr:hypothetical protein [Lentibacillus amyloliquefaciens]ALX47511.1 hypothetical protein AOX59_02170 [Lentibacillus amyloliquefaciens]
MKNKTRIRITLGMALYVLLCIFDYMLYGTVNWASNVLEAIVGMVIMWFIVEFVPNHIEK